MQGCRKQIKSGEAISIVFACSVRAKHAQTRGVWGHAPPENFCIFRSSEVVSEPVSVNYNTQ